MNVIEINKTKYNKNTINKFLIKLNSFEEILFSKILVFTKKYLSTIRLISSALILEISSNSVNIRL